MTGRGRVAWRLAGVAVATLALMAGCSTGVPAPDQGGSSATTAAPLPAAVTLPPAPSGRPATGLVGAVGSDPGSISLARLDPTTLRPLPGPRVPSR